jgi:predicted nucleic acid-binding protein
VIRAVFLDSSPLGIVTQKQGIPEADACRQWVRTLGRAGVRIFVPEIADYEIRRELIRTGATAGIARLDTLIAGDPDAYLPLTTAAMRKAAALWAEARNRGYATADPKALDGDVILAAQAIMMGFPTSEFIVATDNVRHLSRYVPADEWGKITS